MNTYYYILIFFLIFNFILNVWDNVGDAILNGGHKSIQSIEVYHEDLFERLRSNLLVILWNSLLVHILKYCFITV